MAGRTDHSPRHSVAKLILLSLLIWASFLSPILGSRQATARAQDLTPDTVPQIAADHHLHIRTRAGAEISEQATGPIGADEVIAAMDAAGVGQGLVISIAYMFGAPDAAVDDEYRAVRAENDFVAREVAKYPERLVGACSVNPLAEYAVDEIERCADDERLQVLKIHLTNSGVELRDAGHVARLAEVFGVAGRLELPVIAHMRTANPEYGSRDAAIFIDEILSRAPRLPVQIAHMAGWGGYDDATDDALGAFVAAFADGRLDRGRYTFDLGAVVFNPAAAGPDTALARQVENANQTLAGRIRQLGVDRVVYATDWPSWPPVADTRTGIARNVRLIEEALPLTPDERLRLFGNVGGVMSGRR